MALMSHEHIIATLTAHTEPPVASFDAPQVARGIEAGLPNTDVDGLVTINAVRPRRGVFEVGRASGRCFYSSRNAHGCHRLASPRPVRTALPAALASPRPVCVCARCASATS